MRILAAALGRVAVPQRRLAADGGAHQLDIRRDALRERAAPVHRFLLKQTLRECMQVILEHICCDAVCQKAAPVHGFL